MTGSGSRKQGKKITHTKVLAFVFILAVFYIGSATFPATITNIAIYLDGKQADTGSTKGQIDESYHDMLDFKHSNFKNKGSYINLNGLMARLMGQRKMNTIIKLDNGHLTNFTGRMDIGPAAAQLTKLHEKQAGSGKVFLYVQAPHQIPKYEDIMPAGCKNYANQNVDDLLDALSGNGVSVLDLREELRNDGIDHSEAFFVTDHHWKPETGFWAFAKIIDCLEKTRAFEPIDPKYTDINAYNIEVYEEFYLGSSGKRTGIYYSGIDDFALITAPLEEESSIDIPFKSIGKQVSHTAEAYNMNNLRKQNPFLQNTYFVYGNVHSGEKHYRNDAAPVDLKVLALGDSFSIVPYTFMPLVFKSFDQLDMRHYEGDFESYYSGVEPDIVVLLSSSGQSLIDETTTYDFFNDSQEIYVPHNEFEE